MEVVKAVGVLCLCKFPCLAGCSRRCVSAVDVALALLLH